MKFSPIDNDFVENDHQPNYRAQSVPREAAPHVPGQITYAEFLLHCEKTGQKARPIGAYEPGGYLGPTRTP